MEEKIDLVGILISCAKKWRFILIMALVGALCAGGYYWTSQDKQSIQSEGDKQIEEASEDNEKEADEETIEELRSYKELLEEQKLVARQSYESKKEYWTNSIRMHLDWEHLVEQRQTFLLEGEGMTGVILHCTDYVTDDRFLQQVLEQSGIQTEAYYLRELISTKVSGDAFQIVVIHDDIQVCHNLTAAICDAMEQELENYVQNMGISWRVDIEDAIEYRNSSLRNEQENAVNAAGFTSRQNMKNTISGVEETIDSIDEQLQKDETKENEQEEPVALVRTVNKLLVYAFIGGIGFAILAVFCVLLGYLLSDKVYTVAEVKSVTDEDILAQFFEKQEKKQFLFDRWINNWERKHEGDVSNEEFIQTCKVLLRGKVNQHNIKQLLVVDQGQSELMTQMINALQKDVKIVCAEDLSFALDKMQALQDSQAVLVIAHRGKTKKGQLYKELEYIRQNEKECFGIILL